MIYIKQLKVWYKAGVGLALSRYRIGIKQVHAGFVQRRCRIYIQKSYEAGAGRIVCYFSSSKT